MPGQDSGGAAWREQSGRFGPERYTGSCASSAGRYKKRSLVNDKTWVFEKRHTGLPTKPRGGSRTGTPPRRKGNEDWLATHGASVRSRHAPQGPRVAVVVPAHHPPGGVQYILRITIGRM